MRRHAKASIAGSTQRQATGLDRILGGAFAIRGVLGKSTGSGAPSDARARGIGIRGGHLAFAGTALSVISLLLAAPALAGTATDRPLLFSFDGSDTSAGAFTQVERLGIDQTTGDVYVLDVGHDTIDKFHADGTAASFVAAGTSSLSGIGTPEGAFSLNGDGDISVDNSGGATQGRIYVNRENGPVDAFDPEGNYLWQLSVGLFSGNCGTAVDAAGHLWVGNYGFSSKKAMEFDDTGSPPAQIGEVTDTTGQFCRLNVDASGDVFLNQWNGAVDKYVGGNFASTLDPGTSQDIEIDQSSATGHLFTIHSGDFNEYESSGTLVKTLGAEQIDVGRGIAYNKSLDRVYVADDGTKTVKVFGPLITGAVPDVTVDSISNIGITTAQLDGTVNPQGVNNSWSFEWKTASQSWAEAQSSSVQSVPVDSSDHPVSFEATGLSPNAAYNVRLVASNTDLSLTAISAVEDFDNVRASATTLGAAPRTDTTARLNASINARGKATTYRFEYSEDGSSWSAFPSHGIATGNEEIVVSEMLTNLQPNTTYYYRVSVENNLGPAVPQGEEVTFVTRSTAEMNPAQRGIELVNSPDKGNQNVLTAAYQGTSPMTADGEKAIWNVNSGAPGSNTAVYGTFLAERTSDGWQSRGLTPPPEQQVGNAEAGGYALSATNPDLSSFVLIAGEGIPLITGGKTFVRVDANQNQTILKTYEEELTHGSPDMTGDGAHVLYVDRLAKSPLPAQLEDIGSGSPETVSLMPDGLPNECGLDDGDGNSSFIGGGNAPRAASKQWRPGYHMIATTDASRVYFQAPPNGSPSCETALYGIYERNRDTEETILIDPGAAGQSPQFIRATPDGRTAYFLTYSNLDPTDTNSHPDVYRWREEAGESTCLTCVVSDANVDFITGGLGGEVLVSDDFSHVYFESMSQLVPGRGKAGDFNLYVLSEGEIRFVARSAAGVQAMLAHDVARLSRDGSVLVLKTHSHPGMTSDEVASNAEEELFLYDDRDGSIECLSCRRSGLTANDVGSPETTKDFDVSADGSTVAFATKEALVPLDVNHGVDIYEWRGGVVRLISDGVSTFPTAIIATPGVHAVSADGRDVLFSLVDPGLTGFEQDGFSNLYDARIGGGFERPTPPVHCSEDSCQGPLQAAPVPPGAASTGFSGRGNQKSGSKPRRPCANKRGRARRRCIRKHKRRSQKARVQHNAGRVK